MAEIRKRGDTYQISVFLGRDEKTQKKLYERTTFKPDSTTPKAMDKEAEDFARSFEKRVKDGELYQGDKITFSQFVRIWEENFLSQKGDRIREEYKKKVEKLFVPAFGSVQLTKVRATHIDNVLNEMKKAGKAPKTVRYAFTTINSVFKYAYKKGYVKENPCARCDDLPRVEQSTELHYFTVAQAKTFLNALTLEYTQEREAVVRKIPEGTVSQIKSFIRIETDGTRTHVSGSQRELVKTEYIVSGYTMKHTIPLQYQAYFNLAIFGGFRRGEICALTWEDINFEKHSVSISKSLAKSEEKGQYIKAPKTKAGIREIMLPEECFNVLRKWYKEERALCLKLGTAWEGFRGDSFDKNPIFIDLSSGKRMSLDTPSHKFREIVDMYNEQYAHSEEEKLPHIRLHDLRHTSATLLLANNTDIETVSKRLGHSKASITLDVYGHAMKEMDEKASQTLEKIFATA